MGAEARCAMAVAREPQNGRDGGAKRYRAMTMPAKTSKGGQAQGLGSNPDPDPYRDNRQRYDDHQHINRQPCGYALCRLCHNVSLRGPRYVPEARKRL